MDIDQQTRGRHSAAVSRLDVVTLGISALAAPALIAMAVAIHTSRPAGPAAELQTWIGLAAGALGVVLTLWWLAGGLGALLWVRAVRRGEMGRQRRLESWTPAVFRRVAAAALGINVLLAPSALAADFSAAWTPTPTGVTATTPAAEAPASPTASAQRTGARSTPSAAWTPSSPAPTPPGAVQQPRLTTDAPTHTVRRGDCLWDIAGAELGPEATVIEIDLRWRRWYEHNQRRIGSDPHLLTPGTVLIAPPFDPYVGAGEASRP
ncbi:MAG: hypothetical protein Q4G34_08660 [Micrococcus sp.]|nr:hypothetical protein [Micrococcus sp.]